MISAVERGTLQDKGLVIPYLESAVCTCGTPKRSEQVDDEMLCAFAHAATLVSAVSAASLPLHALLLVTNTSRKNRLRIMCKQESARKETLV